MILPPYSRSHSQTRASNASRPSSRRELPCRSSSFSTTLWVEIPAWSKPPWKSTFRPCIRFIRTSASPSESWSAWPRWSSPVTFGGGKQ